MSKRFLIVVDVQNDFVSGTLGTEEAKKIVPKVVEKVRGFDGEVLFTMDTHGKDYMDTQEGRLLPVRHCIAEEEGWQLAPQLEECVRENAGKVTAAFRKNTFGSVALAEYLKREALTEGVESVELVGLCTDICVVSNALLIKAYMPEIPVLVDSACCAGVTVEKHLAALEVMRSCQILVS